MKSPPKRWWTPSPWELIGPYFPRERHGLRYAVAVGLLLITFLGRFALIPAMGTQAPLMPCLIAVLFSQLLVGTGPAIAAGLLAPLVATGLFTRFPAGAHPIEWSGHVTLFLVASFVLIAVIHALQKAYRAQSDALHAVSEARQSALESASQLQTIADALPVLIAYVDSQSRYQFNNRRYEDWFGVRREDIRGRPVRDLLNEETYSVLAPRIAEVLSGKRVRFEWDMTDVDGHIRHVQSNYIPDFAPDGTVRGFFGLIQDLTELKQAERAVRNQERLLKLIYDNSSDCLYLAAVEAGGQFRFISVNQTFLRLSGYTREQVENQPLEAVLPAENHPLARSKYQEVIASKQPLVYYETANLPAGVRHGEITLIPIVASGGQVTHILGATKDVTARRKAEQALIEADRRKDEFLAMLAHELRNPLAPIRNIGHILANENLERSVVHQASQVLQRQVTHLTRLVDDLLDVARITRGLIDLRREIIALATVLDAAAESVAPLIAVKHQVVHLLYAEKPLFVYADALRLAQVFENLLSNAAKYSPDRAAIEITAEQAEAYGVITVSDEGVGIDAQLLPRVFDLFVQAGRSLDRSQGGLGVGLTIVRSLVEMHGGSVAAHSAGRGLGSRFVVRLPLVEGRAQAPEKVETDIPSRTISRQVLIVEDNVDSGEVLAMLLRSAGHEVRLTHEGAEAFALLESHPADFILLDIGLPGMNGYDIAKTIRERFPDAQHRIYALTGYGREEDRQLALESGFDGHLTKPVDPTVLLAILNSDSRLEN